MMHSPASTMHAWCCTAERLYQHDCGGVRHHQEHGPDDAQGEGKIEASRPPHAVHHFSAGRHMLNMSSIITGLANATCTHCRQSERQAGNFMAPNQLTQRHERYVMACKRMLTARHAHIAAENWPVPPPMTAAPVKNCFLFGGLLPEEHLVNRYAAPLLTPQFVCSITAWRCIHASNGIS